MTKSQTPIDGIKSQRLRTKLQRRVAGEDQSPYDIVDLRTCGFTTELASELRQRLLTFEEDWNAPGMEAYENLPLAE